MKIGVIGLGAIGSGLCQFIESELHTLSLEAVSEIDVHTAAAALANLKTQPKILDIPSLVVACDLIIEAAHKDLVGEVAQHVLRNKKDLIIMSVGGLLKHPALVKQFKSSSSKLYLPSGAIGGLDIMKAAACGALTAVTLRTTKGKEGFIDAPYVVHNRISLDVQKKTVIFRGNASEAVNGFPKNINVAALIALAGVGADKTQVEIAVDPQSKRNIHELTIEGSFGRCTLMVENVPSPQNPKTSYLAVLSVQALLKQLECNVRLGT